LTEDEFEKYHLPGKAFNKVKKPLNLVHKKKIITPEEEKISLEWRFRKPNKCGCIKWR
jgi:hypothetical protein